MVCPVTHPSDHDVIKLINTDNDAPLTVEQVKIEEVAVSSEHERNTVANAVSTPESPYGGQVQVFYDRWDLQTLFHGSEIWITASGTPDLTDAICGINAEYGTTLDGDEFTYVPNEAEGFATLTAKPESAGYTGTIKVNITLARVPLSERLTTGNLNGFLYPNRNRPSPNNLITTDLPVNSATSSQTIYQNNGRLRLGVECRGPGGITYPTTILGRTQVANMRVGGPIGSGSYRFPTTDFIVQVPNADGTAVLPSTFAELVEAYDMRIELWSVGSENAPIVLRPKLHANGITWQWINADIVDGMNVNSSAGTHMASFTWSSEHTNQSTLYGKLKAMGMGNGSGGGGSAGTTGLLQARLIAEPKDYRGKTMDLARNSYRS